MARARGLWRRVQRNAWSAFAFYVVLVPPAVAALTVLLAPLERWLGLTLADPARSVANIADALLTTSVTLLTVAISVMIIVLSMTSQQISPRAITEQLRRPLFRNATGFLFGCFATGAAALSGAYGMIIPPGSAVILAGLIAALLFGAVWAFVGTIHNAASNLQINKILSRLGADSRAAIDDYFARFEALRTAPEAVGFEPDGAPLLTRRSGYVERIDWPRLASAARDADARVRVLVNEGDFSGLDRPVLTVIAAGDLDDADWAPFRAAVTFSPDRAPEQHPYRALSVVADIALKGLSPAFNDPTTAMSAIDYLSDLIVVALKQPDARRYLLDADGAARVERLTVEPRAAFDHAFRQIAHYCAGNDGLTAYLTRAARRLALADLPEDAKAAALWFLDKRLGVEGPAAERAQPEAPAR